MDITNVLLKVLDKDCEKTELIAVSEDIRQLKEEAERTEKLECMLKDEEFKELEWENAYGTMFADVNPFRYYLIEKVKKI